MGLKNTIAFLQTGTFGLREMKGPVQGHTAYFNVELGFACGFINSKAGSLLLCCLMFFLPQLIFVCLIFYVNIIYL